MIKRGDRVADLLGQVTRMNTAKNAARVMRLVRRICQEILLGKETNKDGKVSEKNTRAASYKQSVTPQLFFGSIN